MNAKPHRIVFCLLAALVLIFVTTPRSVTSEVITPKDALSRYAELADTSENTDGYVGSSAFYLVTVERTIGSDETFVFLPRVEGSIRDVGTSGSSDWSVTATYAAYLSDGGALVSTDLVGIGETTLSVTPAANTAITYPNHSTPLAVDLGRDAWGREMCYPISLHASTRDSALTRDVSERCTLAWSGEFFVRTGLLRVASFPFSIAVEAAYRNNV